MRWAPGQAVEPPSFVFGGDQACAPAVPLQDELSAAESVVDEMLATRFIKEAGRRVKTLS
jgi:hypothetical protein